MRGRRLPLTKQQHDDLLTITSYELTVPKAISAKLRAWGGKGFTVAETERLTDSIVAIREKLGRL